jgi:hypothetical protein
MYKLSNGNIAVFGRMETIEERAEIENDHKKVTLDDEIAVLTQEEFEGLVLSLLDGELLSRVLGRVNTPQEIPSNVSEAE